MNWSLAQGRAEGEPNDAQNDKAKPMRAGRNGGAGRSWLRQPSKFADEPVERGGIGRHNVVR